MKILIACEESQTVCREMRRLGHEAYSCDIQECSGGHPEWHIKGDVLPLINGRCEFVTMDGEQHEISDRWDMLIAHPPCTYLSGVTTRHLSLKMTPPEKVVARMWKLAEAAVFFMQFALADCERICRKSSWLYVHALEKARPDSTTLLFRRKPGRYRELPKEAHLLLAEKAETASTDNSTCAASALRIH